jgi:hypothetical protein
MYGSHGEILSVGDLGVQERLSVVVVRTFKRHVWQVLKIDCEGISATQSSNVILRSFESELGH